MALCTCHWPELEVWCRDRLRVSGSTVCGSVRGGGGDGRRAGDGGYGCGVGVGQGKEWTKDGYGPTWIKDSVAVTNLLAVAAGNCLPRVGSETCAKRRYSALQAQTRRGWAGFADAGACAAPMCASAGR